MNKRTVSLPTWNSVHRDLDLKYVDEGFYEETPEQTKEGYVVVDIEGHAPYLLMIHGGYICEVGRVEKEHDNQNLGTAYVEVDSSEVRAALGRDDGTVSVYELPEEVCMSICKVINSEMRYGDLNTDIASISDIFDRLGENGFSGSLVFTSPSNYSYVEMRDGEVTDCWHRGNASCSTVDDLQDADFKEDMEVNIFRKEDVEGGGSDPAEPAIETSAEDEDEGSEVDYDGIAAAVADSVAGMVGRGKFYENLSHSFAGIDGVEVDRERVVADNPSRDNVLDAIYAATERSAKMTSTERVIQKAREGIEDVEGGEEFLKRAE